MYGVGGYGLACHHRVHAVALAPRAADGFAVGSPLLTELVGHGVAAAVYAVHIVVALGTAQQVGVSVGGSGHNRRAAVESVEVRSLRQTAIYNNVFGCGLAVAVAHGAQDVVLYQAVLPHEVSARC